MQALVYKTSCSRWKSAVWYLFGLARQEGSVGKRCSPASLLSVWIDGPPPRRADSAALSPNELESCINFDSFSGTAARLSLVSILSLNRRLFNRCLPAAVHACSVSIRLSTTAHLQLCLVVALAVATRSIVNLYLVAYPFRNNGTIQQQDQRFRKDYFGRLLLEAEWAR